MIGASNPHIGIVDQNLREVDPGRNHLKEGENTLGREVLKIDHWLLI